MASFELVIKPSAGKEIRRIPLKDRQRILAKIRGLTDDPRPPGCQQISSRGLFRVRQGVYRIVYLIQDERLVVLVVKVAHRREVYRRR